MCFCCAGVRSCGVGVCVGRPLEDFVPLPVSTSQEDQGALAAGVNWFVKQLHNISNPARSARITAQPVLLLRFVQ